MSWRRVIKYVCNLVSAQLFLRGGSLLRDLHLCSGTRVYLHNRDTGRRLFDPTRRGGCVETCFHKLFVNQTVIKQQETSQDSCSCVFLCIKV